MYSFTQSLAVAAIISSLFVAYVADAAPPPVRDDGVTLVNLDEYNGYFAAEATLGGLKAGEYEFVITNKAEKLVGFQIQNFKTQKNITSFPIEPGETKSTRVTITTDGVRYRCPINPTPWYDLDIVS